MFTPRKCGVKFDPPTLVVYYEANLSGKKELTKLKVIMEEFLEGHENNSSEWIVTGTD